MKKINLLIFCFLFIFLILMIPKISAEGDGENYPAPTDDDWVVNSTTNVSDEEIVLNGNLIIKQGGKLTLDNVTLKMNCTKEGEFKILVEEGGEFYTIDTNITSYEGLYTYAYKFYVNGTMELDNCEISNLWSEYSIKSSKVDYLGGIEINSNDLIITNCKITDFRYYAINCKNSDILIDNCTIEGVATYFTIKYGIVLENSNAKIFNNTFINYINNLYYGIYSKGSNATIYGNKFSGILKIYYYDGNVTIKKNTFTYGEDSISCNQSYARIIENEIIGLSLNKCNDVIIENNNIYSVVCDFSSNIKIIKNEINEMRIYDTSAFVENNTIISKSTSYGIVAYGTNLFIYNNTIKDYNFFSYYIGISIYSPGNNYVKIKKNHLLNNSIAMSGDFDVISDNIISNNDLGLLIFEDLGIIHNNIFEKNKVGVQTYNTTALLLTDNQFKNNEIAIEAIMGKINYKEIIDNNNIFENNDIIISQKRYIQILVTLPNGTPIKDVSIIVRDRDGEEVWNGTTNTFGIATNTSFNMSIILTEYKIDRDGNEIRYSPYNITAKKDNVTNWKTIELNENINNITITLQEPKANIKEAGSEFDLKFMVGLISLILFFALIILSLIGVIPQDRLPIQTALVIGAFAIVIIAFIAHNIDSDIAQIGATDISGMVIIHPITALVAGFLVAGALEAAGAFDAAADLLDRLEKFKFKGKVVFGIPGTIVILVNVPTIIAMPCGRILGSALMPAALYFGYKVAKQLEDPGMVGVIVFAFIVNAAASCGPSPLGGIGTLGEGLTRMEIGSFSDAQQIGIIMATGVCALIIKFVTPLIPADLQEKEEKISKKGKNSNAGGDI